MSVQKKIIITNEELNALKKAIFYLKFECEDVDSLLYAGSPYINTFLEKIIEMDELYDKDTTPIGKSGLSYKKNIISKIRLLDKEEGEDENREISNEEVSAYLYPFSVF
ncbi:hypothetical protein LQ939_03470 [Pantoea alhagi]|uniref:hypothetical protein n=1 Tax=Pantoea alhagi TaxID=1891675 RepID=UPI00202B585D|nr:hypothetical protein [Pantoea alhagi]URQ61415.1 hypothetical protein LQ939_03470 [Pantoea alhagi]